MYGPLSEIKKSYVNYPDTNSKLELIGTEIPYIISSE